MKIEDAKTAIQVMKILYDMERFTTYRFMDHRTKNVIYQYSLNNLLISQHYDMLENMKAELSNNKNIPHNEIYYERDYSKG